MQDRAPLGLRYGPFTVYLKTFEGCPSLYPFVQALPATAPFVWFDSPRFHEVTGRWSVVGAEPWLTFVARGDQMELRTSAATHIWREHPLEAFGRLLQRYHVASSPLQDGVLSRGVSLMGWLSYDLNRWIERLPVPVPSQRPVPEMAWFGMKVVVLLDHQLQRGWILSLVDPHSPSALAHREAIRALDRAEAQLNAVRQEGTVSPARVSPLAATTTQPAFEGMVLRALEAIRAGDIFQANISQRFTASWSGQAGALYQSLRQINPSPFACWLSCDELSVVSCSPERLVRVQDGRIDTRPIAGTRPRGATPADDALQSLELLLSEKERAEHIMLVDLARNDLGRVCAIGSVAVDELMTLEEYSHVIHIVSQVSGRLRAGLGPVDVIRATFPGGTITGCPKVRCMEMLRELEPVARGLYTGSLGYVGLDGTMDLNIAIRTMVIQDHRLSFHVGAGIVADSDPEREYHETLAKAAALMRALQAYQPRQDFVHAPAG